MQHQRREFLQSSQRRDQNDQRYRGNPSSTSGVVPVNVIFDQLLTNEI
jgi:hypothetical protein